MMKYITFFCLVIVLNWIACGEEKSTKTNSEEDNDTATDTVVGDEESDDDSAASTDTGPETACSTLFGSPNDQTGLDDSQCRHICDCDGESFTPTTLFDAQLDALQQTEWLNPLPALTVDPYETPAQNSESPNMVCGIIFDTDDENAYRLETYDSIVEAQSAGAAVTHTGACGLCSSLADLAVYMRIPDLTNPVRQCGIEGVVSGEEANIDCLLALGFTENCAQIWYYNTVNTRTLCMSLCAAALNSDYHLDNGNINDCLQCDEDNSGPVFKAVSGRTRRNSGLPTAICRPCESVSFVNHNYL